MSHTGHVCASQRKTRSRSCSNSAPKHTQTAHKRSTRGAFVFRAALVSFPVTSFIQLPAVHPVCTSWRSCVRRAYSREQQSAKGATGMKNERAMSKDHGRSYIRANICQRLTGPRATFIVTYVSPRLPALCTESTRSRASVSSGCNRISFDVLVQRRIRDLVWGTSCPVGFQI